MEARCGPRVTLTERFDRASGVCKRGTPNAKAEDVRAPYVSHLLGVCSLVLEDGGSEDEAIAALLHDSVEDRPKCRRAGLRR